MGRWKERYPPARVRELDSLVLIPLAAYCLANGDRASGNNCLRELISRPEAFEALEIALDDYHKKQFQKLTGESKPPPCR